MALPQPEYYTPAELADYFKKMHGECTPALIIRYIETRKLVPSFRFKHVSCRTLVGNDATGWKEAEPLRIGDREEPFNYNGLFSMTPMSSYRFWINHYPITDEWEADLQGKAFCCGEDQIIPLHPLKVTAADFLITKTEVLRFEAEHSTPATPEPAELLWKVVHKKTVRRLHKENGKFPSYDKVIVEINRMLKLKDDEIIAVFEADWENGKTSTTTGLWCKIEDKPLYMSTHKNFLSEIKPEILKMSGIN